MKAVIRALAKKRLPHPISGEPAPHVAAEVDFLDDAGKVARIEASFGTLLLATLVALSGCARTTGPG